MTYNVLIRTSINGVRVYPGQTVVVTPDDHVNSLVQSGALVVASEIVTQDHRDTHREVEVHTREGGRKEKPTGRGRRPANRNNSN